MTSEASRVRTEQPDGLRFRQTFDGSGRRLRADYVTDPARSSVPVDLDFRAGRGHGLYAVFDPSLGNSRNGDSGRTVTGGLVASDGALAGDFRAASSGSATGRPTCGTGGWTGTTGRPDRAA
ncbi:hypothetical protein KOI35_33490 [Actinoplanes bogorensis]|uniref:Glucodextranase N-terminal domain-containing protein n=1 Tax=Paractinoplanes bogorensis TaxID=1610840 RepID=A0ABS5YYI1_9ACTN|nr:hypothetical protein [Actinoplanes bogorensis]MBU2668438.1 hypothetical protein [Actinoplanes bogorensis]